MRVCGWHRFGASVSAFWELYRSYNYSMVYCEAKGVNCAAVRDDVLDISGAAATPVRVRLRVRATHPQAAAPIILW